MSNDKLAEALREADELLCDFQTNFGVLPPDDEDDRAAWERIEKCRKTLAAHAAEAAQAQAQSGEWAVVPIEPTREMQTAGKHALKGSADSPEWQQAVIVYQAMLAAAPQQAADAKDAARYRFALRPEVADAVSALDETTCMTNPGLKWYATIRAELLRQAREIADLRESILGLRAMREDIEAELDDAKRMFWCLLRSHNAPMIVSAKAMMAYRRREADLVRQDLPSGDVEFRAVLNKKPDEG